MTQSVRPGETLDVRTIRKSERHPLIFAAFDALEVSQWFVLHNDHDPKHLREEFETGLPQAFGWEYLSAERGDWRIKITKLASTPLPMLLVDRAAELNAFEHGVGAVWKLQAPERDLDANIVAFPPGQGIGDHVGPDLDVLVLVLAGSGTLTTERTEITLEPGGLVWLPRRSQRAFTAGPDGLRYFTVHQRRQALTLDPAARPAP